MMLEMDISECSFFNLLIFSQRPPHAPGRIREFLNEFINEPKTQKAWFEKIYPNFPGAQLACTDTDSFLFSVKSENIYEDLKKIENFWDFSTLPKDHKHHNAETANKLGLFKLETGADKIFACAGMVFSLYKIKNYKSKN